MELRQDAEQRMEHHGLMWLLRESDFQAVEALASAIVLVWGVLLALPVDTFSLTPSFAIMRQWADERTWSTVGLVLSLSHIVATILQLQADRCGVETTARWARRARVACVFLLFAWWVFVSLMLLAAAPFTTGGYTYAGIATGAFWSFLRLLGKRRA